MSALLGRMPSAVGYQPTLQTEMGALQERITSTKNGSITSVQAVYVPADDLTDPAPATTFAHLDATTEMCIRDSLRVIGIMWGLAAVVLIVGAILFAIHPFPYFPYVSGEVLGTLVSGLLMWHRFNTLDVELDMAKKNAIRHLRMQASVRSRCV